MKTTNTIGCQYNAIQYKYINLFLLYIPQIFSITTFMQMSTCHLVFFKDYSCLKIFLYNIFRNWLCLYLIYIYIFKFNIYIHIYHFYFDKIHVGVPCDIKHVHNTQFTYAFSYVKNDDNVCFCSPVTKLVMCHWITLPELNFRIEFFYC